MRRLSREAPPNRGLPTNPGQFGGLKTCNQCHKTLPANRGNTDPEDGFWYCTPCWSSYAQTQRVQQRPASMPMNNQRHNGVRVMSRFEHPKLGRGTIRFIGRIAGKMGIYCGLELDQRIGKHDGILEGIRYFQCQPNHGAFLPFNQIKVISSSNETKFNLEQRVTVNTIPPPNNRGIIKYIGAHHPQPGVIVGVQLDSPQPNGTDGTFSNYKYFTCPPGCGLLFSPNQISPDSDDVHNLKPVTLSPTNAPPVDNPISDLLSPPAEPKIPGIPAIPKPWEIVPARTSLHVIESPVAKKARAFSEMKGGRVTKNTKIYVPRVGLGVIAYVGNQHGVPMCELVKQYEKQYIEQQKTLRDSLIVGVCLKDPRGTSDGHWKSLKLFCCPPRHGIWLRYKEVEDIRATERLLLRYLTQMDEDTSSNHLGKVMNIVHNLIDYSFTCGAGRNKNIFRDLSNAIESRDIVLLRDALQEAFMSHIPQSAPMIIKGRRLLHELVEVQRIHILLENAIRSRGTGNLQEALIEARRGGLPPNDKLVHIARDVFHELLDLEEERRRKEEEALRADMPSPENVVSPTILPPPPMFTGEDTSRSLSGRCDAGFFVFVQIYYGLEILSGGGLIIVLVIDSAWGGFPLIMAILGVMTVLALDWGVMYVIRWTKATMMITAMTNVCLIVVIVMTLTAGHGQILTIFGSVFCGFLALKLLLMMQCKSRLIGNRKAKSQQKQMQSQQQRTKAQGFGGVTPVHQIQSARKRGPRR